MHGAKITGMRIFLKIFGGDESGKPQSIFGSPFTGKFIQRIETLETTKAPIP